MNFPMSLSDISLWFAFTAIILLVTSELLYSLPQFSSRIAVDKKRLRIVSLGLGICFLVTVVVRIFRPY
jgi:hypothetical protein